MSNCLLFSLLLPWLPSGALPARAQQPSDTVSTVCRVPRRGLSGGPCADNGKARAPRLSRGGSKAASLSRAYEGLDAATPPARPTDIVPPRAAAGVTGATVTGWEEAESGSGEAD